MAYSDGSPRSTMCSERPAGPKLRPTLLRYPCLKRWSSSSRAPSGAVSPPGTPHGRRRPPSPFFATSLPTRFLQRNSFASWTRPIKGRLDMLSTGMRTPIGLKISGADLGRIEQVGANVEALLSRVRGTRGAFAARVGTGYFLNFRWNREQLARYGLSMEDAQQAVENAIGGEDVTTAVLGRERYPVNVRYMRDFRSDLGALERVLVPAGGHRQLPLGELAEISTSRGPSMIRDENGLLTGYVYVDIAGRDPEGYIAEAGPLLRSELKMPTGYAISWSGQYEAMERVRHHT